MIYVFDIDGTICETENSDYEASKPIPERIAKVNELYEKGNYIIFHTARGMGRNKNSTIKCYQQFYEFTRNQLVEWGIKFDELYMGKPAGHVYIDDKGISDDRFFTI